ncbi:kinesin-like protein KIF21B isoform X10 [Channa argus]|uniref:kinesin-like protein KIF21B isoform X10 n=1 Tax=Channa argus TaxID=215402 RepID=UPI00352114FB
MASQGDCCVKVALRIRPQMSKEKIEGCHVCTLVTPGEPQVLLGKDKAFTYDFVFDIDSEQDYIYQTCVYKLIEGCFEGYNATVFAYGQTGSGKTYTMGTGFDVTLSQQEQGIIPRAVHHLFAGIQSRRMRAQNAGTQPPEFKVSAQFLELYNEEILDLFDEARDPESRNRKSNIKIHEDASGSIYTTGVTSRLVHSEEELLQCLKLGALSRTTASTQMNAQSSRSHAIFTIYLCQMRVCQQLQMQNGEGGNGEVNGVESTPITQPEYETLMAKFHFVDLAGSERLKRTGATGERAREGISINCGLLALGNVISALGDHTKKGGHVPYRDSKLTRLLQDSLGGNSRTVMIACISPSDRDFMETLNTLKYANRARNIKNKVVVNQDKTSQQISALRAEIARLQMELMEYKAGKRVACEEGSEGYSDLYQENAMLQRENDTLRLRVKAMQETIDHLNTRVTHLLANEVSSLLTKSSENNEEIGTLIQNYIREVEEMRTKLLESEAMNESLRRQVARLSSRSPFPSATLSPAPGHPPGSSPASISMEAEMTDVLRRAKLDIERLKKKERRQRRMSPELEKGLKKRVKLHTHENGENGQNGQNGEIDSDDNCTEDIMSPLQEESGCEEDEGEDEEEGREEDEFDSDESLVDSDSDSDEKANFQADLADLTCEIEIKQKLIDELENSQRRLLMLKLQYEEKLILLQNKIRDTQLERDRVLQNLMSMENYTEEKANRIKQEYEKRLKEMNRDLLKLQTAQKEHARLLKNQGRYERELKKLQAEVNEMKKAKVVLMKQMKEEQQRRRMVEAKRNREITQLKKEQRRQEYQIRALESQKRQQELVLRRKTQEVTALRRLAKPMSDRVAGRVARWNQNPPVTDSGAELSASTTASSSEPETGRTVSGLVRQWNNKNNQFGYLAESEGSMDGTRVIGSRKKLQCKPAGLGSIAVAGRASSISKSARQKWQALERRIMDIVMQRMTIANVEADMDRLIKKREELTVQQEALSHKREVLMAEGEGPEAEDRLLQEINEEIEVLNANIDYINDSLSDCQATIVQIEETKDELDSVDTSVVISSCSLAEARHLLDHFLKASIDKSLQVAQKEAQVRLLEGQLRQTDVIGSSHNHIILDALREKAEYIPELQALIHNVQQENGYTSTDEEPSEFSQASDSSVSQMKESNSHDDFKIKTEPRLSAQMKAVSAEYLGPILDPSSGSKQQHITKSLASLTDIQEDGLSLVTGSVTLSLAQRDSFHRDRASRTISLPVRGHTFPRQSRGYDTSPVTRRKSYDRAYRPIDGYTPPSSPPMRTRNDRNVFSRLTSNQTQGSALDKTPITVEMCYPAISTTVETQSRHKKHVNVNVSSCE